MNEYRSTQETWWVVTKESDILYGKMENDQLLSTMGTIETFDNQQDWEAHLSGLGITPIIDTQEETQQIIN